jgi:hypothetical protein
MKKYLQCKFNKPKDFLGLDITHNTPGEITLSMHTFTKKMREVLGFDDNLYGDVLTPGRTDKKVNREDEHEPNDKYRSYVGTLNWLSMGLRYDIAFTTKELSRVLDKPTKIANEIVNRALIYSYRTKDAHLKFSSLLMTGYIPPKTRRKPTDAISDYDVDHFNTYDGITHVDEKALQQEYTYPGNPLTLTCLTDIDLAGQPDTRQSTSAYTLYLNGTMFHWRAHTEKLIIKSTAAGEYIALSRGNQACKHVREILKFFGNTNNTYYLYTDNQAAEHIATQPNMTDHSRSIDIRHHEIKQDYVEGGMRIGGVSSDNNTADILTKNLQPPTHANHCAQLHILKPNVVAHTATLYNMHLSATKESAPTNPLTKQQKRRAKRQRKRERDYRLLAHPARNELYHLTNHETTDVSAFLTQMHKDREFFSPPHNPAPEPPRYITPQRRTRHPQCPTCLHQTPNRTHPSSQKRHTPSNKSHTPSRSAQRLTPVNNKRMTKPTQQKRAAKTISIFTQRDKTKIQTFQTSQNQPVNIKTKSKRENDKKTHKPKRNQSQKFSPSQPYRTKDQNLARSKNVANTTTFCPTSSRSSNFGQPNSDETDSENE